jgi:hypothetical protein
MRPAIQLSIPEPCHENWDAMTPETQGRFCQSCAKVVVDFTAMSDAELLAFFANKTGQSVCGRLAADQLQQPIQVVKPMPNRQWFWRYAAAFMLLMSRSEAKAQGKVLMGKPMVMHPRPPASVSGRVVDEGGNPVSGATIKVKGTKLATVTNTDGSFSINSISPGVLEVSAIGFEPRSVEMTTGVQQIVLTMQTRLTGEVVVVGAIAVNDEPYVTPDVEKHRIELTIVDQRGNPVRAAEIGIKNLSTQKTKIYHSDTQGQSMLRRVREDADYTITVNAKGYEEELLAIAGYQLQGKTVKRRIVLLEKRSEKIISTPASDISSPAGTSFDPKNPIALDTVILKATGTRACEQFRMGGIGIYSVVVQQTIVEKIKDTVLNQNKVRIYPNPVSRTSPLQVELVKVIPGQYRVRLISMEGRVLQEEGVFVSAESFRFTLPLRATVAAGEYVVVVINPKQKIVHQAKVMVL